jgi:hypothetical protein
MSSSIPGATTGNQHPFTFFPDRIDLPVMKLAILFGIAIFIGSLLVYVVPSERSGWILMTSPLVHSKGKNSLACYAGIAPDTGEITHYENYPFKSHVRMFSGCVGGIIERYNDRPLYTLISMPLNIFLSVADSFKVINIILYAVSVLLVWLFAYSMLQDNTSAWMASLFSIFGIGYIVHLPDMSAHLMSYFLFTLSIYILYRSQLHTRHQGLAVHLLIGTVLAIYMLGYSSSIAVLGAYIVLAFSHNNIIHLMVSSALAISPKVIWMKLMLPALGQQPFLLEFAYIQKALSAWIELLEQGLFVPFLQELFSIIWQFVSSPVSPIILLLSTVGLVGLVRRSDRDGWFIFIVTLSLLGVSIPFGVIATARGYMIFGLSIFCYTSAAYFVRDLAKYQKPKPILLIACLSIIVVVCQLAWNTQHLIGNLKPVGHYFLGTGIWSAVSDTQATVISLTGNEQTPALFGGSASLDQVKPWIPRQSDLSSSYEQGIFIRSLFAQSLFCILFLIFIIFTKLSNKLKVICSFLVVLLLFLSAAINSSRPNFTGDLTQRILSNRNDHQRRTHFIYSASIGNKFLDIVNSISEDGDYIQIRIGRSKYLRQVRAKALINGSSFTIHQSRHQKFKEDIILLGQKMLSHLKNTKPHQLILEFALVNLGLEKIAFSANKLDGRSCYIVDNGTKLPTEQLPHVELRLFSKHGQLKLVGF